jgi:hypothetical protein
MENGRGADVLTLTTESPRAIAIRLSMIISVNLMVILIEAYAIIFHKSIGLHRIAMMGVLDAIILAVSLFLWWGATWGTWLLDAHGIEFYPRFGRYRRLRWDEIDCVRWETWRSTLRGNGVRISIPWEWLPRTQVKQGKARIEGVLSTKFDLTIVSPIQWPTGSPTLLARSARLLGIAILATTIWLGVGFWIVNHAPLPASRRLDAFRIWSILVLLAPFWWVGFQYQRTRRLVHPRWPWRCRRSRLANHD